MWSPTMKLFVDCESTGLSWGSHSPITIASIITDDKLRIIDKSLLSVKPLSFGTWSDEAEDIHGLSKGQVSGFSDPLTTSQDYLRLLEQHKVTEFYCHAMSNFGRFRMFDYQMLEGWLRMIDGDASNELERRWQKLFGSRVYSTIATTQMYQRTLGLENQKLNSWAKHIGFELIHHDAESDCECLYEVYKYQIGLSSNHWDNKIEGNFI